MFTKLFRFSCCILFGSICAGCASKVAQSGKNYAFWPPYPDEPRLQFLTSISRSSDIEGAKSGLDQLILGQGEEKVLPINKPYGVAMFQGKIYVCDLRNGCITVLDLRKHQTLVLGATGGQRLQRPSSIAISPDGFKYVTDVGRDAIVVFNDKDEFIGAFTASDVKPVAVAVFENELFVTDFQGQKVVVLDRRNGKVARTFGAAGSDQGQFIRPLGIAVDSKGFVYVTDVLNCRLQKFTHEGKLIDTFGAISANAGGMVRPKHITVDRDGIIYVVDAAFQNVQLFDQQGHVLTFFGAAGNHPGAMYLPVGIAVNETDLDLFKEYVHPAFEPKRLVIVTNQFGNNKVSIYAFGQLRKGKTVQDIAGSKGLVPNGTADPSTLPSTLPTTAPADIAVTVEAAGK